MNDFKKEAYFLATLGLILSLYKIWRFWGTSDTILRAEYGAGLAASVYGFYAAYTHEEK